MGANLTRVSPSNSRFPLDLHTGFQIARTFALAEVWSVPLSDREKIDGAGGRSATELKRVNGTSLTALFTTKPLAGTTQRAPVRRERMRISLRGPRKSVPAKLYGALQRAGEVAPGGGSGQTRATWYERDAYWYEERQAAAIMLMTRVGG